jgi:oxygen-independent coproporphyrinogen III oxidase
MAAGLYVHVPFCARRCAYCDFYAEVQDFGVRERTVAAILAEARLRGRGWDGGPFDSVFVGGGTPSHLGAPLLRRLLTGLQESLPVATGAEWTLEANPESATTELLDAALAGGANRLSLGVQSFDDRELAILGRLHDSKGAADAVARARHAGFENLNLDLIYALPLSETARSWERTLRSAIDLSPEHVSCYLLDLEPHVPLASECAAGRQRLPGEHLARKEYETARRVLARAGFEQYEISNWARPGSQCRHNLNVWEGGIYLGIGPGAHGHHDGSRRANSPALLAYLTALEGGSDSPHESQPIDQRTRGEEALLLGLRLRDGIAWDRLGAAGGAPWASAIRERAARWTGDGLLEDDGARLRLGEQGLFVSNAVMAELLGSR